MVGLLVASVPILFWRVATRNSFSEAVAMADYTKREQPAAEMREAQARETNARYTIFSNDFDPLLRTPNLTLGQAIRVLQSRTGCKVYFERMDRGLGVGFRVPHDPSQIAPTAGSVRLNIVSRNTDIVGAKKELVLACRRRRRLSRSSQSGVQAPSAQSQNACGPQPHGTS